MSITKTPTGKYYVSIFTEQIIEELPKTGKQVGIDLGLKDFLITSDNKKFKNNRYTKKYAKKLKKAQQHLSRKQKGSNGFEKQKLKVAKIHEKIASCRLDTLHKVSRKLVNEFDIIVCEDLNVKGMIKNHKLSKHIADASWGNFVTLLQYKCDWYGKELVKVNRFYPSSKTCSDCGWINQELRLSDREWTCKSCGVIHDRDWNASKNILKEGLKNISAGTVDYKGGEEIRPTSLAHSVKPEAHSPSGNGQFTRKYFTLKISSTQKRTLEKLKSRNIKVSDFVRKAISEKIQRDYAELQEKPKKEYCPFG